MKMDLVDSLWSRRALSSLQALSYACNILQSLPDKHAKVFFLFVVLQNTLFAVLDEA